MLDQRSYRFFPAFLQYRPEIFREIVQDGGYLCLGDIGECGLHGILKLQTDNVIFQGFPPGLQFIGFLQRRVGIANFMARSMALDICLLMFATSRRSASAGSSSDELAANHL